MAEDFIKEVKEKIEKLKHIPIEYGKSLQYLCFRNNTTKEDFEQDILSLQNLERAVKQERKNETRYALYFLYSKNKGRVYVLRLDKSIRVITIYPLGRRTLLKYARKNLNTNKTK